MYMRKCLYKHCDNIVEGRKDKLYCRRNCKQNAKDERSERIKERKKLTKALTTRPYIVFKKDYCELCGFIPINSCQLDADHIDGNHQNNNINNIQTLCANCHRLKTFLNKDWEYKI